MPRTGIGQERVIVSKPKGETPLSKIAARISKRFLVIVAVAASACFIPWKVVYAFVAPLPPTVREAVEAAPSDDVDGIIVYVDQAGRGPALYVAGLRDKRARLPMKAEALFKIASISKLYIAAATAKLVQAKRLSLNDTLASRLPEHRTLPPRPGRCCHSVR